MERLETRLNHAPKDVEPSQSREFRIWGVGWKQWIPVGGLYHIYKDMFNNKPHIGNGENTARDWIGAFYHIDSVIGSFYALFEVFGVF